MELIVCAVRDVKVEAFGDPFFSPSIGSAIRSFDDGVNHVAETNSWNKHPEDYALYALGKYDNSTGTFDCPDIPKLLVQATEVKKSLASVHHISKV